MKLWREFGRLVLRVEGEEARFFSHAMAGWFGHDDGASREAARDAKCQGWHETYLNDQEDAEAVAEALEQHGDPAAAEQLREAADLLWGEAA